MVSPSTSAAAISALDMPRASSVSFSSKWGVVRHGWVAAKLALVVSVMAVARS